MQSSSEICPVDRICSLTISRASFEDASNWWMFGISSMASSSFICRDFKLSSCFEIFSVSYFFSDCSSSNFYLLDSFSFRFWSSLRFLIFSLTGSNHSSGYFCKLYSSTTNTSFIDSPPTVVTSMLLPKPATLSVWNSCRMSESCSFLSLKISAESLSGRTSRAERVDASNPKWQIFWSDYIF